jgi:hypothetical protein
MPIISNEGPKSQSGEFQLYTKGKELKERRDDFYAQQGSQNQDLWLQASYDNRFESGDQSAYFEIHTEIPDAFRKTFSFNRIRRVINMISGYQRRNRHSTRIIPVENADQQTADQYSKVIDHINRKEHVLDTISASFRDSLISGMSMMYLWVDFREDPVSGVIKVDRIPYSSYMIDPFFKKKDLSDCNQIWRRSYLTKEQIISLLPDKKSKIKTMTPEEAVGMFNYMPETMDVSKNKFLSFDEFYYLDSRKKKILIDSTSGETMEIPQDFSDDELREYLRYYPNITVADTYTPTVRLAIFVQDVMMYDGPNQLGIDEYPFIPTFGYFNPSLPYLSQKVQGVVRDLRDPQFLYNRRKAIEDDLLSSQINSGMMFKEGALVNPKDAIKSGQGKPLIINRNFEMSDVQKIPPGEIPPSMFQLSEQYANEIMEISGVNEELIGSAVDDKAGVLAMLRQGAGLTTLHELFDNLDTAQKILGSRMLKAIQANYTPGKIERIIEEQPTEQFYNKAFGIYDAAVDEGFDTATQRQNGFAQLMQLRERGIPVPDETIIEAATLQNKTQLIQDIQQNQQAAQQAEMEAKQVEMDLHRAQANLANAKVESDLSLAKERDSRVYSNIGLMQERAFESEKDKTQALLNVIKSLKEIDSVDIDQLMKLVRLNESINQGNKAANNSAALGTAINKGVTKDMPEEPEHDPKKMMSEI